MGRSSPWQVLLFAVAAGTMSAQTPRSVHSTPAPAVRVALFSARPDNVFQVKLNYWQSM
ncbi:MAG: hypothetical protein ABIR58_05335 [Gemmatimonadaceae bacterium]